MRLLFRGCLVLSIVLAGCTHVHESSAKATPDQLGAHLSRQLSCSSLALQPNGLDSFKGSGTNDVGPFDITVTRTKERVAFEGKYVASGRGGFNGSFYWNRRFISCLGFHRSKQDSQSSFSTFQ